MNTASSLLVVASILCDISSAFIFDDFNSTLFWKIDCEWMSWKEPEACESTRTWNVYRARQTRDKIEAEGGGADCEGTNTRYVSCSEVDYLAAKFLETVASAAQEGSSLKGPKEKPRVLSKKHRDILFLLDESYSVGEKNFKKEVELAKVLVDKFSGPIDIAEDKTRVGVLGFDIEQHPMLNFKLFEKTKVLNHLEYNVKYNGTTDGATCLYDALTYTRNKMFSDTNGARLRRNAWKNTEQVVILVTDGCANCRYADLPKVLKKMAGIFSDENISFIVFMIGENDYCMKTMANLADGSRCYQVHSQPNWAGFDDLISSIRRQREYNAWYIGEPCDSSTPAE